MEEIDEFNQPMDIHRFCRGLEEAWGCIPEEAFGYALDVIFNGYDLRELTPEEMEEMLNDFILQNQ